MIEYRPAFMTAALFAVGVLISACAPMPGGGGTTTTTTTTDVPSPPVISTFTREGVLVAPALIALRWTVSDPNGETLTCRLDGDGDGTAEVVVNNCAGTRSRNISFPTAVTTTATLTVEDGNSAPVTASVLIDLDTGTTETFDLVLRGVETLDPVQAQAFTEAEAYWESAIVRGKSDFPIAPRPACLPADSADLPAVIDDVIIDVSVTPIDGPGSILGQAGPTCYSTGDELPLTGIMEFDTADVIGLLADGTFDDVILHEMAHVLGIGTLWNTVPFGGTRTLLNGAGSANPRFIGDNAVAEYSTLGASGNVPVESTGGPGTRDAHWSETVFGNELMTGFINPGQNPTSRLTLASLADLGYRVDVGRADTYSLPGSMPFARSAAADRGGVVLRPVPAPAG